MISGGSTNASTYQNFKHAALFAATLLLGATSSAMTLKGVVVEATEGYSAVRGADCTLTLPALDGSAEKMVVTIDISGQGGGDLEMTKNDVLPLEKVTGYDYALRSEATVDAKAHTKVEPLYRLKITGKSVSLNVSQRNTNTAVLFDAVQDNHYICFTLIDQNEAK